MSETSVVPSPVPFASIVRAVLDLAKKYPDRQSEDEYFNGNGEPECIFGHAFDRFQISDISLEPGYCGIKQLAFNEMGVINPTASQARWAARVQDAQDAGKTWAAAVALAGPVPA